jgi:hypothetical protein
MDKEIIERVVNDVINNSFVMSWKFYVLYALTTFVVACGAAYLAAYWAERGKNFATKTDFDELKKHLAINTKIAEEIKTNISHEDWVLKENKTLKRVKLEELLLALYEVETWLDNYRAAQLYYDEEFKQKSPMFKVEVLANLYFEDLAVEIRNYKVLYRVLTMTLMTAKQELLDLKSEEEAIKDAVAMKNNALIDDALLSREQLRHQNKMKVIKKANDDYVKVFADFYVAQHKIEDKAADLMAKILEAKVGITK